MFLDFLIVAVLVFFAISGYRRGLIYSLVGIIGSIVASIAAAFVSSLIALPIYQQFFMTKITEIAAEPLSALPTAATAGQQAQTLFDSMPQYLSNILNMLGINADSLTQEISNMDLSAAQVLESLVRPSVVRLISIALTIILFGLFAILINVLANVLTKTIDLAQLSIVNKIAGAALGIVEALVVVMVLSLILHFVMYFLPTDGFHQVQSMIDGSFLYKGLYRISLPDAIISGLTLK